MSKMKSLAVGMLVGVVLAGGWYVQRALAPRPRGKSISEADGARLFDAVLRRVEESWVDSSSAEDLYRRATAGMVAQLGDSNTAYLTPDRLRRLREVVSGSYRGVGMSVDIRDGWMTVVAPRPGSPAERAGIRGGRDEELARAQAREAAAGASAPARATA